MLNYETDLGNALVPQDGADGSIVGYLIVNVSGCGRTVEGLDRISFDSLSVEYLL